MHRVYDMALIKLRGWNVTKPTNFPKQRYLTEPFMKVTATLCHGRTANTWCPVVRCLGVRTPSIVVSAIGVSHHTVADHIA